MSAIGYYQMNWAFKKLRKYGIKAYQSMPKKFSYYLSYPSEVATIDASKKPFNILKSDQYLFTYATDTWKIGWTYVEDLPVYFKGPADTYKAIFESEGLIVSSMEANSFKLRNQAYNEQRERAEKERIEMSKKMNDNWSDIWYINSSGIPLIK